jgi:hypothetical protein
MRVKNLSMHYICDVIFLSCQSLQNPSLQPFLDPFPPPPPPTPPRAACKTMHIRNKVNPASRTRNPKPQSKAQALNLPSSVDVLPSPFPLLPVFLAPVCQNLHQTGISPRSSICQLLARKSKHTEQATAMMRKRRTALITIGYVILNTPLILLLLQHFEPLPHLQRAAHRYHDENIDTVLEHKLPHTQRW